MVLIPLIITSFVLIATFTILLMAPMHSEAVDFYGYEWPYKACVGQYRVFCTGVQIPYQDCACDFTDYYVISVRIENIMRDPPFCDEVYAFLAIPNTPQSKCTGDWARDENTDSYVCIGQPQNLLQADYNRFTGATFWRNYPVSGMRRWNRKTKSLIGMVPTRCLASRDPQDLMSNSSINGFKRESALPSSNGSCKPNALSYSKNESDGEWIIKSTPERIKELHSEMKSLMNNGSLVGSVEEWYQSHGGVYKRAKHYKEPSFVQVNAVGSFSTKKEAPKI